MKIFITGFMGSGKTFIGSMLAEKCSMRFIDMDEMIEKRSGKTIAEIFHLQGEPAFREAEREILQLIIKDTENLVVSTGGGTVCFYDNLEVMNLNGTMVYLKLSPDLLFKRLSDNQQNRPLLTGHHDLKSFIEENLAKREHCYRQASIVVEVKEGDSVEYLCDKILKSLPEPPARI